MKKEILKELKSILRKLQPSIRTRVVKSKKIYKRNDRNHTDYSIDKNN